MNEMVEYCVDERRILQLGVPIFKGQLAGNDYGPSANTIVEHFEQIVARALVNVLQSPIGKQQDVHFCMLSKPACEAAVNHRYARVVVTSNCWRSMCLCATAGKPLAGCAVSRPVQLLPCITTTGQLMSEN
jgi:hypothetical protein